MSIACFICLENYDKGEDIVSINRCGHVYHQQCLDEWKRSQNNLSNCCPTCRTTYTKRSLTRLFLGVAEPDRDFEKDIQKLEEEKKQESEEKTRYINELNKVRTDYGIKCQAYNIIDNVNNDYLQCNIKLQEENNRLHDEHRKIREELECMKQKIVSQQQQQQPVAPMPLPSIQNIMINDKVDLTCEDDDDDIEIVSTFLRSNVVHPEVKKIITDDGGVIEIDDDEEDDDDDDVQVIENGANSEPINEEIVETTETPENTSNDGENQQHHSIQPLDVAPEHNPVDVATKQEEVEQAVIEIQKYLNTNINQQEEEGDDDEEPEVKKARLSVTHENDFKFLQDFILSQI